MSATSDILAKLATAPQYHPSSAELFADWSLQAGDQITVKSGEDSYAMPIFNLSLDWNGAASVVVENTGNENRDDLAELNETEKTAFQTARGGYSAQKEQEAKNIGYQTSIDKSLKEVGMTAAALGVQIDNDGNPVIDPDTGEFVWDDTHGATVYSRLSLVANRAQLISAINNPQGTDVISGAKVDLSAQGSVLIQAINANNPSQSNITLDAAQVYYAYTDSQGQPAKATLISRIATDEGVIFAIQADYATFTQLQATNGEISDLTSGKTTASVLKATSSTFTSSTITNLAVPNESMSFHNTRVGLFDLKVDGVTKAKFIGTTSVNIVTTT